MQVNTNEVQLAFAFLRTEPVAAAHLLEQRPAADTAAFLASAPAPDALQILRIMLPPQAAAILELLPLPAASGFLVDMSHSSAAAILRAMEDQAISGRLLESLPVKFKTACRLLLNYPPDAVGAWIETKLVVLAEGARADEALLDLKKKDHPADSGRIYIVSRNRQLVGTLPFIPLLRAHGHTTVAALMNKNITTLSARTSLFSAIKSDVWGRLDAVPVVNRGGELIGELHHHTLRAALAGGGQGREVASPSLAAELCRAGGGCLPALFNTLLGSEPGRQGGTIHWRRRV